MPRSTSHSDEEIITPLDSRRNLIFTPIKKAFWLMSLGVIVFTALAFVTARTRNVSARVNKQSLVAAPQNDETTLTLAGLESREGHAGEQPRADTAQSDAVAGGADQTTEEQVEVEVVTVRPNGFEPREITRLADTFMLAISNHSGAIELALHLDRVQGNRVQEVRLPRGRIRWNHILNLPHGEYSLTEQNHPNWVCHITLTEQ